MLISDDILEGAEDPPIQRVTSDGDDDDEEKNDRDNSVYRIEENLDVKLKLHGSDVFGEEALCNVGEKKDDGGPREFGFGKRFCNLHSRLDSKADFQHNLHNKDVVFIQLDRELPQPKKEKKSENIDSDSETEKQDEISKNEAHNRIASQGPR